MINILWVQHRLRPVVLLEIGEDMEHLGQVTLPRRSKIGRHLRYGGVDVYTPELDDPIQHSDQFLI